MIKERDQAWRSALGSTRVDYPDYEPSPEVQEVVDAWIRGEITSAQMTDSALGAVQRWINR